MSRGAPGDLSTDHPEFEATHRKVEDRVRHLLSIDGKRSVEWFHREIGKLMTDKCGISRNAQGLQDALERIPELRDEFWRDVKVVGGDKHLNQALEHAGRVADFMELAELMCRDALERNESCGCHFREENQTRDGEALRNDDAFAHVAVWEYAGTDRPHGLHREHLHFEALPLAERNYKT